MVHAFVMVKTGTGESEHLVDAIRDLADIDEAHVVAGAYDIIVEVDAGEIRDVLRTASSTIQGLQGVSETRTYIAIDD